jgi:hypothetical protein
LRKALLFVLLGALCLPGCGGSGGRPSVGDGSNPNGNRIVSVSVVVTNHLGNILQTFTNDNVAVNTANENQTIANVASSMITSNAAAMPADSTIVVSDFADLNVGNYEELGLHPEYIRYPRLTGADPLDDPVVLFSGGDLQQLFIFEDFFDLNPGLKRIMDYLQNEVPIPTQNGFRLGMGRAQTVTVYVRSSV